MAVAIVVMETEVVAIVATETEVVAIGATETDQLIAGGVVENTVDAVESKWARSKRHQMWHSRPSLKRTLTLASMISKSLS